MSIFDSSAWIVMHTLGISLSLFVLWLFLDRKSAHNSCCPGCIVFWCSIGVSVVVFFEVLMRSLQHPSWRLLPVHLSDFCLWMPMVTALCFLVLNSSLTCRRFTPRPTPNTSVSRYNCSFLLYNAMVELFLIMCLALSHKLWYVLFHVHLHFIDNFFLMVHMLLQLMGRIFPGSSLYLKGIAILYY